MADSTLFLTLSDLQNRVSHYLGFGLVYSSIPSDKQSVVNFCITSGLRQFYYPPPLDAKAEPYRWSFLEPVASITTIAGQATYNLPDNFGGILGDLTYPLGSALPPGAAVQRVATITELQMRAVQAQDINQGAPKYAAVRATSSDSTQPTRWQLLLHPVPDQAYTLQYAFNLLPQALTAASGATYPLGGAAHSETILQSCLAVAERQVDDAEEKKEVQHAQFIALLAHSIKFDQMVAQPSASSPWPIVADSGLVQNYRQLLREAGKMIGYAWDPYAWSHEEFSIADEVVQQGLRMFYGPPPLPGQAMAHEWTFLRPEAEIHVVAGQDTYDLPEDVANIYGDLHYVDAQIGLSTVKVLPIGKIRRMQAFPVPTSSRPNVAGVVAKNTNGVVNGGQQIVFFPVPDANYTFVYQYKRMPPRLSDKNPIPLGGPDHTETILQAVLAAGETRNLQFKPLPIMGRGRRVFIPRPQGERFMERLAASVACDSRTQPESMGYNGDPSNWRADRGAGWGGVIHGYPPTVEYNGGQY